MTKQNTMTVAAFYKFADLPDFESHQQPLKQTMTDHGVKGSILIAHEGINGTIAGRDAGVQAVLTQLRALKGFDDLDVKLSYCAEMPFGKAKVRLKKEIVTFRKGDAANPAKQVGTYVEPKDWNDLISSDDVTLLDTRNKFEVNMGTFEGAVDPSIKKFTEFADYVEQNLDPEKTPKIAMFCTGGIRCEKASAYMLSKGFKEVYHLKGGILKYLEEIKPEQSKWQGGCFVFDERVAVSHGVTPQPVADPDAYHKLGREYDVLKNTSAAAQAKSS